MDKKVREQAYQFVDTLARARMIYHQLSAAGYQFSTTDVTTNEPVHITRIVEEKLT